MSTGSGIQPWEKHEVCPPRFVKSTRRGTWLEVVAFRTLQWSAPVCLARDTIPQLCRSPLGPSTNSCSFTDYKTWTRESWWNSNSLLKMQNKPKPNSKESRFRFVTQLVCVFLTYRCCCPKKKETSVHDNNSTSSVKMKLHFSEYRSFLCWLPSSLKLFSPNTPNTILVYNIF